MKNRKKMIEVLLVKSEIYLFRKIKMSKYRSEYFYETQQSGKSDYFYETGGILFFHFCSTIKIIFIYLH